MKEFINKLNKDEIAFLKKENDQFDKMTVEEFEEWLTTLFQEEGIEDIEINDEIKLIEKILDKFGDF